MNLHIIGKFQLLKAGTIDYGRSKLLILVLLFTYSFPVFSQPFDVLAAPDVVKQTKWVDSVYSKMTLNEKIGQLFMVMAFSKNGEKHFEEINNQIKKLKLGGIIFSLGGPVQQTLWLRKFKKSSRIPLLIGMDAEWGVSMRLDSVRKFPWNMTLGAIQDNEIVKQVGKKIALQNKRLGVQINFAPDVDINTNPKNPIIGNRSFGENPKNVAAKGVAFFQGMESVNILSSAKHFPGHGDTSKDSHLDLPVINFTKERIDKIELYPFKKIIEAGVSSVMVAHLNIPVFDSGIPSSLSKKTIGDLLIKDLGFKGLVISDALNMSGVSELEGIESIEVEAFLAGNDILLIPNDIKQAFGKMKTAYRKRVFSKERLEKSVKKILKAKYKAGLSKENEVSLVNIYEDLNSEADSLLIAKAMKNAVTVIKNSNILPLNKPETYGYVELGDTSGAFFYNRLQQLIKVEKIAVTDSLLEQAKHYKTIIIGFHKSDASPWAAYDFTEKELKIIQNLAKYHKVVLDVFARPYALMSISDTEHIEAIVESYQNSPIAQKVSADLLVGKILAKGKLPVSINENFKEGFGIPTHRPDTLAFGKPWSVDMNPTKLNKIDDLVTIAIDSMMTPSAQVLVARKGKIVYQKSFGHQTYEKKQAVSQEDLYDLASLTKILATLPLIIKEVDMGNLKLETTMGELNPIWKNTNKENIKVKDMLSHYAKFTPWVPFYKSTLSKKGKLSRKYFRTRKNKKFNVPVTEKIFTRNSTRVKQLETLNQSELRDSLEYKYSDLPFHFMQYYLEEKNELPLSTQIEAYLYSPLKLKSIGFNPALISENTSIVPSEEDDYFRNQRLVGTVHDMEASLKGGVSGHAGLFSTAQDIAVLMQLYLNKGTYRGMQYFKPETFDLFNTCYFCDKGNRRGIGFDKPDLSISENSHLSADSFGHSGFTGTYTWADPDKELIYVFLSNRTYPKMNNYLLVDHNIRTRILKAIYQAIED